MDIALLKGIMALKGINQNDLASKLGISPTTLSYKLTKRRDWHLEEMKAIKESLNLTTEQIVTIFFAK